MPVTQRRAPHRSMSLRIGIRSSILDPGGIVEISRGSRSDRDDHPRIPILKDLHPERCAGSVESNTTATLPRPAAGVGFLLTSHPRVFGRNTGLDPGLISTIPP